MKIRHLFLSSGHNYFGHHGSPADRHTIIEAQSIECVAGFGIRGDRFFGYKPDYKGQITFFAWETYEALCHELTVHGRLISAFRRNVITVGAQLCDLIGREFQIQGVRFQGTEECKPCYWMDEAFAPGANELLKGRGGLRAMILSDGILQVDHQ
jgi:MOSC domain-containing protein YiiM